MATYKLMYFDGRGLAELSRYIFEIAEQPYEDFRWEFSQWADFKPLMPFGQAPCLEVTEDGNVYHIAQSNAMARFLGSRFNLAGGSDVEKARVDMVLDQLSDLNGSFRIANYMQPDEESKKAALAKFAAETLPPAFAVLEKWLAKLGTEFFAGSQMTIADLNMAIYVDRFAEMLGGNLDAYPLIKNVSDKVNAHPKVAAWKQKRPNTQF